MLDLPDPRRDKAQQLYDIVVRAYGERQLPEYDDNLRQLVTTVLSHRTTGAQEREAFDRMWHTYGTWDAIRLAPTDDLIDELAPVRFPERKAPYIQGILQHLHETRGEYSIDFLAEMSTEDGLAWLQGLTGVGVKTATLVMLFCFHRDVMPVDTHVHRVSRRVGLIPDKTSAEKAHDLLLNLLERDPHYLFNFHRNVLKHGQAVCFYNNPACERCQAQAICDDYARRLG